MNTILNNRVKHIQLGHIEYKKALERIDNADITTIPGFCSKTLLKEAIEYGNNFNTTIEKDAYSLINEIVEDYKEEENIQEALPLLAIPAAYKLL